MRLAAAVGCLLVAAGCFSVGTGDVPIEVYLFDPIALEAGVVSGEGPVLLVNYPRALAAFDTPRIAYTQRAHEVAYYAFSEWSDAPPRMLEPLLIRALDATGHFGAVVRASASGVADLRLDTDVVELIHDFTVSPSQVRITLRVQLHDLIGHSVLATQIIAQVEAAPSDDAYGAVRATNNALGRALQQVAEFAVEGSSHREMPAPAVDEEP